MPVSQLILFFNSYAATLSYLTSNMLFTTRKLLCMPKICYLHSKHTKPWSLSLSQWRLYITFTLPLKFLTKNNLCFYLWTSSITFLSIIIFIKLVCALINFSKYRPYLCVPLKTRTCHSLKPEPAPAGYHAGKPRIIEGKLRIKHHLVDTSIPLETGPIGWHAGCQVLYFRNF